MFDPLEQAFLERDIARDYNRDLAEILKRERAAEKRRIEAMRAVLPEYTRDWPLVDAVKHVCEKLKELRGEPVAKGVSNAGSH